MERAWKDRDIQGITDKIDGNSLFGMYSVSKKWRIPDLSMEEEDKILLWFKQNGRYAETKQIKENICLLTYRMGNPYVLIAQYANQVLSTEIHTDRRLTSKLHCDRLLMQMEQTMPERAAEIITEQPQK